MSRSASGTYLDHLTIKASRRQFYRDPCHPGRVSEFDVNHFAIMNCVMASAATPKYMHQQRPNVECPLHYRSAAAWS